MQWNNCGICLILLMPIEISEKVFWDEVCNVFASDDANPLQEKKNEM